MLSPLEVSLPSNLNRKQILGNPSVTSGVKFIFLISCQKLVKSKIRRLICFPSLFQANYCHPCPVPQSKWMNGLKVKSGHFLILLAQQYHFIRSRTAQPYRSLDRPSYLNTASSLSMIFLVMISRHLTPRGKVEYASWTKWDIKNSKWKGLLPQSGHEPAPINRKWDGYLAEKRLFYWCKRTVDLSLRLQPV